LGRRVGTEQATRFADAETVRWTEWALQSYFRVLLGVAFLLLGAAAVVSRLVPTWLGVLLVVAGLLSPCDRGLRRLRRF
jgi:hypothetical protein